jgi:hypothetical protein
MFKTNPDCNGCRAHSDYGVSHKSCRYTQVNYIYIPGCPCHECLVKVTCNAICGDMVYLLKHRLEISDPFRNDVVGQIKERDFRAAQSYSWGSLSSSKSNRLPSSKYKPSYLPKMISIKAKRRP